MASSESERLRSNASREESIDARRYLTVLRRSAPLMIAIVVVLTGIVLALSLVADKSYRSSAQLIINTSVSTLGTTDATAQQRQLTTLQALVTSPTVLTSAAKRSNRSESQLENNVSASSDPNANLLTITAEDPTAAGAALVANSVASAFIKSQAQIERAQLQRARAELDQQIASLRASNATANADEIAALQQTRGQIAVQSTSAGDELQIARSAQVPSGPASPRPIPNTVLAFFV
jgi:tyrosine-protein kinase